MALCQPNQSWPTHSATHRKLILPANLSLAGVPLTWQSARETASIGPALAETRVTSGGGQARANAMASVHCQMGVGWLTLRPFEQLICRSEVCME